MANITSWYCSMAVDGTGVWLYNPMPSGHLLVVFPFRAPTSGPKMCSAVMMSLLVIGQLGVRLFSTYRM